MTPDAQGGHRWHNYSVGTSYLKKLADLSGSRAIVFDAGPIISLTTSNLLGTLERLKGRYPGKFVITEAVKYELVDEPLQTKKFMFEALQVQRLITLGVFEVVEDSDVKELTLEMLRIANRCFSAQGRPVQIVQYGEVSSMAAAKAIDAEALILDERITRELIEHPPHLVDLMNKRLHMTITTDDASLSLLQNYCTGLKILRSTELISVAFEQGLLAGYLAPGEEQAIPNIKQKLLESVLWGLKLNGCAISMPDIVALVAAARDA